MSVTISTTTVKTEVRKNLDEIQPNSASFTNDVDETDLDTIIAQKIPWAYNYVVGNADPSLLTGGMTTIAKAVKPSGGRDKVAELDTQGKVLRFVFAQSDDLDSIVYEAIWWNTPEYIMLSNVHTTGTKERPKVGIRISKPTITGTTVTGGDSDVIEVYGCDSANVGYIKEPSSVESQKMSDTLYSAFIYYITSLVLLTLHESKHAEDMLAQAMALMGIDTNKQAQ